MRLRNPWDWPGLGHRWRTINTPVKVIRNYLSQAVMGGGVVLTATSAAAAESGEADTAWSDTHHVLIADENTTPSPLHWSRDGRTATGEVPVVFGFTELLPSWNVLLPTAESGGTTGGMSFAFAVRDAADHTWSPWLDLGSWGERPPEASDTTRWDGGQVAIDIVKLNRPADAFRVKVWRTAPASGRQPELRRLAVVTSRPEPGKVAAQALDLPWPAIDLPVPFLAQGDNPKPLRSRTCSPTAVGMVMAYRCLEKTTLEHAQGVYDPQHKMLRQLGTQYRLGGAARLTRRVGPSPIVDRSLAVSASGSAANCVDWF